MTTGGSAAGCPFPNCGFLRPVANLGRDNMQYTRPQSHKLLHKVRPHGFRKSQQDSRSERTNSQELFPHIDRLADIDPAAQATMLRYLRSRLADRGLSREQFLRFRVLHALAIAASRGK